MTDWALSTNLYTWAQAEQGFFAWPANQREAENIRAMTVGDLIVPKFAQSASYAGGEIDEGQQSYFEAIGVSYEKVRDEYANQIAAGESAVPFILRVASQLDDDDRVKGPAWAQVGVVKIPLPAPLSTKEFLRLRTIPPAVAAQFKGSVSPGRHLQKLPDGAGQAVLKAGQTTQRGDSLRRYSLVRATSVADATTKLSQAGRPPMPGDRALLVTPGGILGVAEVDEAGQLLKISEEIPRTPAQLIELFKDAELKANPQDNFSSSNPLRACQELQQLLDGVLDVAPVDDFQKWHDRYQLLPQKVTLADVIARRTDFVKQGTNELAVIEDIIEDTLEVDEEAALMGLTVENVRAELPSGMVVPDSTLAEAVTAIRAGKHLMLGGPPGTGKSTIAMAIARAVMGTSYDVTTATSDWTTFDTIGGYLPDALGGIRFTPGVVLRALKSGSWLIIDELNRADIDRAFGPLFTVLAGGEEGSSAARSTLPYMDGPNKPIAITWGRKRTSAEDYVLTPQWRLIGTLNVADKASLFQLSFAFLRRFAIVDVPLPPKDMYEEFIESLFTDVPESERAKIQATALDVAFGPIEIGPAIIADVARFVSKGLDPVAGGAATYAQALDALITGVRLMVVPQYEGSPAGSGEKLVHSLRKSWPDSDNDNWQSLATALRAVELR